MPEILPPPSVEAWNGIALGAFLAFYAFIGFEDMVNLAEEVKDTRRTLPRGILLALLLTTLIYTVVTTVAVLARTPWLVAEADGTVLGYAYATNHRERAGYRWSVDISVYVDPAFRGRPCEGDGES